MCTNIQFFYNGCKMQKISSSDCSVLLSETPEAYYWAGFILADGHISNRNELSITLSAKDKDHLIKFSEYISFPKVIKLKNYGKVCYEQVRLAVTDRFYIKEFKEKFDIKRDKTYYPPDLSWIKNKNLFLSLLCGYIDGDGTISSRKSSTIQFHVHSSWMPFFTLVNEKLFEYYNINATMPCIGKDGYTRFSICNFQLVKNIYIDILELNIPFLKRKWNRINVNYETKKMRSEKIMNFIKNNPDMKASEISDILKISLDSAYRWKKKYVLQKN